MKMLAFRQAFAMLERRVKLFIDVRLELGRKATEQSVRDIGLVDDTSDGEVS